MRKADVSEVVNELQLWPKISPAIVTNKYILSDFLVSLSFCTLPELFGCLDF